MASQLLREGKMHVSYVYQAKELNRSRSKRMKVCWDAANLLVGTNDVRLLAVLGRC
jgi:hypothetical protein